MKVRVLEIDDFLTILSVDAATTDVPLLGNGPVEDCRTCGHLENLNLRHGLTEYGQRLTKTVAGNTTTDRKQPTCQGIHRLAVICFHAYQAVCPPSIMILTPVTYLEASEERKIIAPTRSSG